MSTFRGRCLVSALAGMLLVFTTLSRADAATFTAVQSGNWNDPATWGGTVPAQADDAVIPIGITVTNTTTFHYRSGTSTVHGTLINNGTFYNYNTFTIAGTLINNSSFNNFANGVFVNDGTVINNWYVNAIYVGSAKIVNNGTFTNNKGILVSIPSGGTGGLTNNGTLNNHGSISVGIPGVVFNNTGTTNNHCGGTVSATVVGNPINNLPC